MRQGQGVAEGFYLSGLAKIGLISLVFLGTASSLRAADLDRPTSSYISFTDVMKQKKLSGERLPTFTPPAQNQKFRSNGQAGASRLYERSSTPVVARRPNAATRSGAAAVVQGKQDDVEFVRYSPEYSRAESRSSGVSRGRHNYNRTGTARTQHTPQDTNTGQAQQQPQEAVRLTLPHTSITGKRVDGTDYVPFSSVLDAAMLASLPPSRMTNPAATQQRLNGVVEETPILNNMLLEEGFLNGILIDISDRTLYHVENGDILEQYPVGVGRAERFWVFGDTQIVRKAKNPTWRPTPRMREENPKLPEVMGPGPNNPLGKYALYTGFQYIAIHGTNQPHTVGGTVSSGCYRLSDNAIFTLYHEVPVGTRVRVRY